MIMIMIIKQIVFNNIIIAKNVKLNIRHFHSSADSDKNLISGSTNVHFNCHNWVEHKKTVVIFFVEHLENC